MSRVSCIGSAPGLTETAGKLNLPLAGATSAPLLLKVSCCDAPVDVPSTYRFAFHTLAAASLTKYTTPVCVAPRES